MEKITHICRAPEEFYNQQNSCYVRVQFFPNEDAFRFEIRNEYLQHNTEEEVPAGAVIMSEIVRGMVEIAMANLFKMKEIGQEAFRNDMLDNLKEDLSDEQAMLLDMKPEGSA